MIAKSFLGIDCGSVSLNLVLRAGSAEQPVCVYARTQGRPLQTLVEALEQLKAQAEDNIDLSGVLVTGSGRELLSRVLGIPAINEITAHAAGAFCVNPAIRTIVEIGGQDSKFIRIEPPESGSSPRIVAFRMNEICAAGTGAFLDEQAARLGIPVESYDSIALQSQHPAPIAGRCAVFAKTDMIHKAQEGVALPDILFGVAFALARNYISALVRGHAIESLVSLQGGVMANAAVVRAFGELLRVPPDGIIVPPHFNVLGALGCAVLCRESPAIVPTSLDVLRERAVCGQRALAPRSSSSPLIRPMMNQVPPVRGSGDGLPPMPPLVMGLDVGSVSVKGVVIDGNGSIIREDYRLSMGRPLDALQEVIDAISLSEKEAGEDLFAKRSLPRPLSKNFYNSVGIPASWSRKPESLRYIEFLEGGSGGTSLHKEVPPDLQSLKPPLREPVAACAVTGSGRVLAGRLLDAELIVNEISAQARAAVEHDPSVDTVIEIGGQDSKWIAIEHGSLKDFEMNRVCAAGTGSFLMEQAGRLGLDIGEEFSDAAFASSAPSDLGTRCTVFMESDLIHHQNNGASREDLAAGVCTSIVRNYLERVANHKALGDRILFLGGVAANPAVRAAFEKETGKRLVSPGFFSVSGAFGAALSALDLIRAGRLRSGTQQRSWPRLGSLSREGFRCGGCSNDCTVDRYKLTGREVFHGGRCDRWEVEEGRQKRDDAPGFFQVRTDMLEKAASCQAAANSDATRERSLAKPVWGMVRSPHFYEWFPFWKAFFSHVGIDLKVSSPANRRQFERGVRYLQVETCLPVKILAGQVHALVEDGVRTIFHPAILNEGPPAAGARPAEHCPYVQASSQFFRGAFDVEWVEPVISFQLDPDAFLNEHVRMAEALGIDRKRVLEAFTRGLAELNLFKESIEARGRAFLESLADGEQALVVLGKPYHTSDRFLNMDLADLFKRLGIPAVPGDLLPIESYPSRSPIAWKYQLQMIALARVIARDARLFPVMITFYGCGPDPFTMRHIKESLKGKPLLILEMDEHSSRAGIMTRMEAYLDSVRRYGRGNPESTGRRGLRDSALIRSGLEEEQFDGVPKPSSQRRAGGTRGPTSCESAVGAREGRVDTVYFPYFGDHAYAFAAAARSVDIDSRVLPPPDEVSAMLGRPHLMGGECHPYALILGDYLKLAQDLGPAKAGRSLFCVPGYSACRLGQYPVYIEKVRKECGHPMRVIADLSQALTAFGLSKKHREAVQLRTWEGLIVYDVLLRAYLAKRALAGDPPGLNGLYQDCRDHVFQSLSRGKPEQGLEEALQELSHVSSDRGADRPVVAVTGDYYTRIVSFANNDVYEEIERLGGTVWSPPTFSDGLKHYYLLEATHRNISSCSEETAASASFYSSLVLAEMRIKGSRAAREFLCDRLDPAGARARKIAALHIDPRFPPGIAAPLATALDYVEQGAHGLLNLITLNCSYGTVVTAVLGRALKDRRDFPLLTLVYDGLKKTNERTRLEAFMEQVHDHFRRNS